MTYPKGLHPGATWRKCDFQVHTPRDPQWTGSPSLPGGGSAEEQLRDAWADKFVDHCISLGLLAIAITDHHDFCFVEYVQRAIQRLPDQSKAPWLFPGVEVTCDDAVQCLVLFDTDSPPVVWHRLFGGHLLKIQAPDADKSTNPQALGCGKIIADLLEGIANDIGLSECSIVLPHASNDGAHKSMLRTGFHTRFKQLPFDGVYTDKAFSKLDDVPKRKIHGKVLEWGNRRRGIIPTGDNRKQSFERLGANTCWIRLGEPTAESIRQALLADEARIAYDTPTLPAQRILGISVNSTLTGTDFSLSFNDGFTALIGGRGSGKSALLEYLRFGLGRCAGDMEADGLDVVSREQKLVVDTLHEGEVTVTLERDGVQEKWSRRGGKREIITVALTDGTTEELTIAAAQQRFRARAFYQKQLSTLVSDRRRAADQITGIAAAESVDQRHLVDQDIASAKREVQSAFQQIVEFWVAQGQHNQSLASVADLNRRIDAVKKRLEESGLTEENQKLLDAAPIFNLVSALSVEAKATISSDIESIRKSLSALPSIDLARWTSAKGFSEVDAFLASVNSTKAAMAVVLDDAVTKMEELDRAQRTLAVSFSARQETFNHAHQAAFTQQINLSGLIDETERLVADLQLAEAAERRSAIKLKSLEGAPSSLDDARKKLADHLNRRRKILEEAAAQVEGMSAGSLRAQVRTEQLPEAYLSSLVEICEKSAIRELQAKCEDRVREILAAGPDASWHAITDIVLSLYKHKIQTSLTSIEPGEEVRVNLATAILKSLTTQQSNNIYARLDDVRVVRMLTATPDDFISFEYNDAKGYIPFEQASPGQQAAALLHLLLNQEAGTLIIDQPEEDLDNKIIMKIAGLVQTTKRKRQLIFATHNPNFVVNGDSDKVVALVPESVGSNSNGGASMPRISIDADGAIETPAVRSAITETMEGGQNAFELRGRKYLFL
jgi:chromosome segregation protein